MKFASLRATAVAIASIAACAAASAALPVFTLDPSAAGLAGSSFQADDMIVSDYSTVHASGSSFTESGYLDVAGFELGGSVLPSNGLNSAYSLYIQFSGAGTTSTVGGATVGSFTSLNYTLYGVDGAASFSVAGNTPSTTATGAMALASGSLIDGTVLTLPSGGSLIPSASASLSFNVASGEQAFFASPSPFYDMALTAFINTTSEVQTFNGGFDISQGGGSVNFAAPVPEPETYALMLAGLGVLSFIAKRRKPV